MIIRRAKPADLSKINELFHSRKFEGIPKELINNKDLSFVAEHDKKIVGFIWCGIMAGRTIGFIDFLMVDESFAHLGISRSLYIKLTRVCKKLKVRDILATVRLDGREVHVLPNAQKMGLKIDPVPHAVLFGGLE